jgi:hypothetical protein
VEVMPDAPRNMVGLLKAVHELLKRLQLEVANQKEELDGLLVLAWIMKRIR